MKSEVYIDVWTCMYSVETETKQGIQKLEVNYTLPKLGGETRALHFRYKLGTIPNKTQTIVNQLCLPSLPISSKIPHFLP